MTGDYRIEPLYVTITSDGIKPEKDPKRTSGIFNASFSGNNLNRKYLY